MVPSLLDWYVPIIPLSGVDFCRAPKPHAMVGGHEGLENNSHRRREQVEGVLNRLFLPLLPRGFPDLGFELRLSSVM